MASMSNSKLETRNPELATSPRRRRRAGLSLIEMILAMAISAMLLTATMVAIDASFKAYADAAEQASSQAATRMITNRLITLIRTSSAHGPLLPSSDPDWPVWVSSDDLVTSAFIELVEPGGDIMRVEWRDASDELWLIKNPGEADEEYQQGQRWVPKRHHRRENDHPHG